MTRISEIRDLSDCDTVTAADLEACRKELGCTPGEFAEHLGWSVRKYRELEATGEDGTVPREVVLSVVGLALLLPTTRPISVPNSIIEAGVSEQFFEGNYTEVVPSECNKWRLRGATWTAEIIPDLIRELVKCASNRRLITYRDLANDLEAFGHKRVTRLTLYGRPLDGAVKVLHRLDEIAMRRVPILTSIVVTQNGYPGEGFENGLYPSHDYERYQDVKRLASSAERAVALQREVFEFPHWDEVLTVLGLR